MPLSMATVVRKDYEEKTVMYPIKNPVLKASLPSE
jgi:hypothetical protein